MDYLRGHATASASGLFVICRWLSTFPGGQSEDELRRALQVLRTSGNSDAESAVLTASLAIGAGLGLFAREAPSAPWMVETGLADELQAEGDRWPWFRGELLYRITQRGLREIDTEGKASDLVRGLTWFLQLSPLSPPQLSWSSGPETLLKGFDAINRSEQWRPFQRWAIALGLARRTEQGSNATRVLIPDATTAIADQLPFLPTVASAAEWLAALRKRLPVFGAAALLEQLLQGGQNWEELPPGVVLGLLKLEKANVLSLKPSDDASDVIVLRLEAASARQVGQISIRSM